MPNRPAYAVISQVSLFKHDLFVWLMYIEEKQQHINSHVEEFIKLVEYPVLRYQSMSMSIVDVFPSGDWLPQSSPHWCGIPRQVSFFFVPFHICVIAFYEANDEAWSHSILYLFIVI